MRSAGVRKLSACPQYQFEREWPANCGPLQVDDADLCMQGVRQDGDRRKQVVDGHIQKLLLAFANAPALVDLRVHLPDYLSMSSTTLVSVQIQCAVACSMCTPTKH